jgi:hypothetical protein
LGTGGATDLEIRLRIDGADRVGIDIPLGWLDDALPRLGA